MNDILNKSKMSILSHIVPLNFNNLKYYTLKLNLVIEMLKILIFNEVLKRVYKTTRQMFAVYVCVGNMSFMCVGVCYVSCYAYCPVCS